MCCTVNYAYYSVDYGGSILPPNQFEKLLPKASRYVDKIIVCNIPQSAEKNVKNAVCAVLEALYSVAKQYDVSGRSAGIKSESNDGVSVTYAVIDPAERASIEAKAMHSAAELELAGTGLMYRGV